MTLLSVILLALIQGLTEFLPVSSSGHLALGGLLMKVPGGDISFEVVVHLGTLMAVLAVYRKDLTDLLAGIFRRDRGSLTLAGTLAVASVPAALAGYFLQDSIEGLFGSPVTVSVMLLITGSALFSTRFVKPGTRSRPTVSGSLLVGVSQAVALLPGISRSGFTISAGLFSGIRREDAARFSFLLSVPAILGAALLKLGDSGAGDTGLPLMMVGFAVSAATGYVALRLLLRFLRAGRFSSFAWYCWLLGIAGLSVSLIGG
ncbi:MAG: undecaprenyl-diphosphate phosphatase [Candidatus Fermentibacteraceae bacterium]|nr:undecaprenyl-diphosphate phosphatase [Candidatus Fermentibacteraceae bacterium]MBN2609410.1 undecaprenyl-diphosphate phosphatase [Candidatus Fermentibacteraceae bacterium]